jgi:hypothetical protein
MTIIIYLIGKPGTGKYTIAQEIARHGYLVCDNQLINTPIFALLSDDQLNSIPIFAWSAIEGIRDSVFDFIRIEPNNNYVLTNVLYQNEGDQKLFDQVQELAAKRNSLFVPVKLHLSVDEHSKRITNEHRKLRYKSTDIKNVYSEVALIHIAHPHAMEFDVSDLTAQLAAQKILTHVQQLQDPQAKIKKINF